MRQGPSHEKKPSKRRMNWDLYYYEQQGNRFYKRYTPFALILTIIAGVIGLMVMITLLILNPREKPNINITVPASSSPSNISPIRQTSPFPLTNVNRPSKPSQAVPSSPLTNDENVNEQAMPRQMPPQHTPSPQPSTPPP